MRCSRAESGTCTLSSGELESCTDLQYKEEMSQHRLPWSQAPSSKYEGRRQLGTEATVLELWTQRTITCGRSLIEMMKNKCTQESEIQISFIAIGWEIAWKLLQVQTVYFTTKKLAAPEREREREREKDK